MVVRGMSGWRLAAGLIAMSVTVFSTPVRGREPVILTGAEDPLRVGFLVGNIPANEADTAIIAHLMSFGWVVGVYDDEPARRPTAGEISQAHDLVLISSTAISANIGAEFRFEQVPLIYWESALSSSDRESLADGSGIVGGSTRVNVINNTHPVMAGIPLGPVTLTNASSDFSRSTGPIASGAQVLATSINQSSERMVIVAEPGATLLDGQPAVDKRVFLYLYDDTWRFTNAAGKRILNNALAWTTDRLLPTFSASVKAGQVPLTVQFSDESAGTITQWHWDFGDGSTSTQQHPLHTYTSVGTYDVSLSVGNGGDLVTLTEPACVTVWDPTVDLIIHSVTQSAETVGLYEPLTVSFGLSDSFPDPFDPDQVDVRFEFTGPSGEPRTIPAFWVESYPGWMARIAPVELGSHMCRIFVSDFTERTGAYDLSFTAIPSSSRGFIRIDDRNTRYLRFDNGEPYQPVGHNLCWNGRDSAFYVWLDNMAAVGMNWARYWMVPYVGQGIEWGGDTDWQLGTYSQSQCGMLDNMLEGARTRGIYVQLCMDSFNGWNKTTYTNWDSNPYNVVNGGMLSQPIDYFTNAEAQRMARRRIRYIVSRWAYSPAVLCWEFWNEVDIVGAGDAENYYSHTTEVADWHRDMAQYVRALDPFDHLRTTSFTDDDSIDSYAPTWELPEMDLIQVHDYHTNLPQHHLSLIDRVRSFEKPIILGEGNYSGVPDTLDPDGQSQHDLIWAAAVVESSAMSWWWDNWIYPNDLYHVFAPLAAFYQSEDWAPQHLEPLSATILSGPAVELYGSAGPADAYLFIRDPSGASAVGLRLRLDQLGPFDYVAEYWDTYNGTITSTENLVGDLAGLELEVPTFTRDLAIKIHVAGPVIEVNPQMLQPTAMVGTDAPSNSFTISNTGAEVLDYLIMDDADWLETDPASGTLVEQSDRINVYYNTASLGQGTHMATIMIVSANAQNSPQMIDVTLVVTTSHPTDFDGDGDVDQEDFGHLQACLTENALPQNDPACLDAKLDGDPYVDQTDVNIFLACMSGANVMVDPHCAD